METDALRKTVGEARQVVDDVSVPRSHLYESEARRSEAMFDIDIPRLVVQ